MTEQRNRFYVVLGPVMGLLALILYVVTLSRGPFPGESANLMAAQLGLDPLSSSSHLLWGWVVQWVTAIPAGGLSWRLNLLSAVCAAAAVGVFSRILADAVWMVIPVTDLNRRAADRASLLAGVVGSIALMGAMPFWFVATRFHPGAFDLLGLFILAKLLMFFSRRATPWVGLVFALCYGVFIVESATLIVFGPLVLFAMLYVLWVNGDLRWGRVLPIVGCLAVGLLAYVPAAKQLQGTALFRLGSEGAFWQALYYTIKGQYQLIVKSLPQIGWLLVIVTGIVPWLAVLMVGRRGLNEEKDRGLYILHGVLTALVLAVLFNVPFAPWQILGPWRLLVTPYALLAFTLGYLTAYWTLFSRLFFQGAEDDERGRLWAREYGGMFPAVLMLGAVVAAGVLNFRAADARPAGILNEYARATVSLVGGRDWLVTDGSLDGNLAVAAKELHVPLKLFNLRQANNVVYMKCLAENFESVRLKSLAEVDGMAFLREWMAGDSNFANRVAVQTVPDLWLAASLQPVPECAVFTGVRALPEIDAGALWARHEAFWRRPFIKELIVMRDGDSMMAPVAGQVVRQLSMTANNLGVVMEDLGQRGQAYAAYEMARQLDTNNVSALLNRLVMVEQGYAATNAEAVRAEFKGFTGALKQKFQIWSLSRVYGYVRMPEAYAQLGMTWAFSGQPGMAVAGFKRAIELAPDRKDSLSGGLAMAYLAQDQSAAGEELLRGLLEKEPKNARLLVSMARLAARGNRFTEATGFLDRAQKAGVSKDQIAVEYAVMHLAAGQYDKARVILQELTDLNPDMTPAWIMLAAVAMQQNDTKMVEACGRKLDRIKTPDFMANVVLAQMALRNGRMEAGRTSLERALGQRPNTPILLELLLRLDVQEVRRDLAAEHVRSLLLQDPGHPFANQVLASMQLERGEYGQAENSLRKSLERKRDPLVMNDLAWVLQEQGQVDEAEVLIREALKLEARIGTAWDTLGMILMKKGHLPEAGKALEKALVLSPAAPSVQFHMVLFYEKSGDLRKAADLASNLAANPIGLSPRDLDELRRVSRRVGGQK